MPSIYTPLRYPGGKAKLGPFLSTVFKANKLIDGTYAEPYAGGAGAAMFLLFRGFASRVHLNDIDRGVVAFWRAVVNHSEKFARRIERVPLTLREWDAQRQAVRAAHSGFDLGFAFFYLNRTNRSGIMNAGVIGGRSQESEWKIDARFNRADLASRVRSIGSMRRYISIANEDAIAFLDEFAGQRRRSKDVLIYLDPPYYAKGRDLYTNFYTPEDHVSIARRVRRLRTSWLMTYDDCPEIRRIYGDYRILGSTLSYSAREVRRGSEVVILGDGVRIPTGVPRCGRRDRRLGFELAR